MKVKLTFKESNEPDQTVIIETSEPYPGWRTIRAMIADVLSQSISFVDFPVTVSVVIDEIKS